MVALAGGKSTQRSPFNTASIAARVCRLESSLIGCSDVLDGKLNKVHQELFHLIYGIGSQYIDGNTMLLCIRYRLLPVAVIGSHRDQHLGFIQSLDNQGRDSQTLGCLYQPVARNAEGIYPNGIEILGSPACL